MTCRGKHPTAWWITCQLEQGHDGNHVRDCAPVEVGERLMFSQHTVRWANHALIWVGGNTSIPGCKCGWVSTDTSQTSFNRHLVDIIEAEQVTRIGPPPMPEHVSDYVHRLSFPPRQFLCGDRVMAGKWSGVIAAQRGPFSWVVIDGLDVPQTHATVTLAPAAASASTPTKSPGEP